MGLGLAVAARNAAATSISTLADAGSGPAQIKIYTGSKPANPDTVASGTLLATITLADPSFGSVSSGVITLAGTPKTTTAAGSGTAGWGRLLDSAGNAVLDGTVTATGGGGDFTFDSTSITSGDTVNLTSGTVTMPAA